MIRRENDPLANLHADVGLVLLVGAGNYVDGQFQITETAFVSVRDPCVRISERENAVDGHIPRRAV